MQRAAARLLRAMAQVRGLQPVRTTGDERARPVEGGAGHGGAMPCLPLRALPPVTLACASGCGVPEAQDFFEAAWDAEISGRSGFTRSKVPSSPPHMIVRLAALAPTSPPETGASR